MEIPGNDFRKISQQKIASKPAVRKGGSKESAPAQSSSAGQAPQSEQVSVSFMARGIQKAQETLKGVPDIRVDKVERIKKEIAEGRFKVDSEELAGKILKDIITESAFLK
ncbi:MAG: flagellar biosynthesis anti-sigma factor FlgM [Nitrospinales bacterium]